MFRMKCILIFVFLLSSTGIWSQSDSLRAAKLTSGQIQQMAAIDTEYLHDMAGIRERAETNYNEPKHIHLQHKYSLLRRLRAFRKILSPEQYEQVVKAKFDIAPDKDWLATFYKKNKLVPIE